MQSLLFDHILEVPLVRNPVKNGTQREPVVLAERGRGTDSRHAVFSGSGREVHGFVFSAFDGMWRYEGAATWCTSSAITAFDPVGSNC